MNEMKNKAKAAVTGGELSKMGFDALASKAGNVVLAFKSEIRSSKVY